MHYSLLFFLLAIPCLSTCFRISSIGKSNKLETLQDFQQIISYLQEFANYVQPVDDIKNDDISRIIKSKEFQDAVKVIQNEAGLPETGHLNGETLDIMKDLRCGYKERSSNFDTYWAANVWENNMNVTYCIPYEKTEWMPKDLPIDTIKTIILNGLNTWSEHTNLKFNEIPFPINIEFYFRYAYCNIDYIFGLGDHECYTTFDGPGKVYAHANPPPVGGVHFDEAENWILGTSGGINFEYVHLHELGHSLGLAHSNVRDSVMYPYYNGGRNAGKGLFPDDIAGIQYLYGVKN